MTSCLLTVLSKNNKYFIKYKAQCIYFTFNDNVHSTKKDAYYSFTTNIVSFVEFIVMKFVAQAWDFVLCSIAKMNCNSTIRGSALLTDM